MTNTIEVPVAVVGAGPVGLSLAIDLAWRGLDLAVLEARPAGESPSAKCNHVSSRSMEIFRRLGLSKAVRAAGLPDLFPNDVVFRTSLLGFEMARIPIPCRVDRYTDKSGPDGGWSTPEPPHRVNQRFFEPILFHHAASQPGIQLLNRVRIDSVEQNDTAVVARGSHLDTREPVTLRCQYLIGCDGGSSMIRKSIGATLNGDPVIQRVQSTHIRAKSLLGRIQGSPGWMNYSYNLTRPGNVIAIDGIEEWLVHCYLYPHEDFGSVDRDRMIRTILGVDDRFEYDIVANEDWTGRRLVADKFRDRRIFICGDAAHLWVPYAGYGMNCGIADAMNLSWLLAAQLAGWGDVDILNAYEAERLPITEQVSRFAMNHAGRAIRERNNLPDCIEEDSPAGVAARAEVGQAAYLLNVQQFACAGLNYGYFYDESPLINYDGERPPSYTMYDYTPSSVPGCRLPHFWLADGRSVYDALGSDYTLLRFDSYTDVSALIEAARRRHFPLNLLDVEASVLPSAYGQKLVCCRPDQHVAWRGDSIPADPLALIDRWRGSRADTAVS